MLGNVIRDLRRKHKLTQRELAEIFGVSTGAVGFWETGQREPSNEMLIKISKFFEVTIDYLLNNEKNNTITIMGSNGSYKKFSLSEKNIKAIEQLAENMEENNF